MRGVTRPNAPQCLGDAVDAPRGVKLSRRQVLALSGAAALVAAPGMKVVGATLAGPLDIVGDGNRLDFLLGDTVRWSIDTAWFGGSPRLEIDRSEKRILVTLSNALYPGTALPADLTCEIRPGMMKHPMTLTMTLGGFRSSMPLEQWLTGGAWAVSRFASNTVAASLGERAKLELNGTGEASFTPDSGRRMAGSTDRCRPTTDRAPRRRCRWSTACRRWLRSTAATPAAIAPRRPAP